MKITNQDKVNIINEYKNNLVPMIQLAKVYGVTRQAIYKILKASSICTLKKRIAVSCTTCGKEDYRPKCQIRNRKHLFCSWDCWQAYLDAGRRGSGPYIESRQGQRIGREVVSIHYPLLDSHLVHHKDRNTLNNDPHNLMVFANQGDHIRHHRGFDVSILWDGAKVK
jgi:hypothetical protein